MGEGPSSFLVCVLFCLVGRLADFFLFFFFFVSQYMYDTTKQGCLTSTLQQNFFFFFFFFLFFFTFHCFLKIFPIFFPSHK